MVKKILGLTKHRMVVLVSVFLFVAITASGYYYYLKTHKTGADTLVKRNTSCVIKVIDKDTGSPVANATGIFLNYPSGGISNSDNDGCIKIPTSSKNISVGDYYQVMIKSDQYRESLTHLSINSKTFSGQANAVQKLVKNADVSQQQRSGNLQTNKLFNGGNGLITPVRAESQDFVYTSNFIDAISEKKIQGAKIEIFDNKSQELLGSCISDETGSCDIKLNRERYFGSIKYVWSANNYESNSTVVIFKKPITALSGGAKDWYLWPVLQEKNIGKRVSNTKLCKSQLSFDIFLRAAEYNLDKKLWDDVYLDQIINNLASTICSLSLSEPNNSFLPVPRITMIEKSKWGSGSVLAGVANINISIDELLVNRGGREESIAIQRFLVPVHEYGHLIDLGLLKDAKLDGRISGNSNWKSLFKLVNASDVYDGYQASLLTNCSTTFDPFLSNLYQGASKCYFTVDEKEFWGESFALWTGQSFSEDLKLDIFKIKFNTINIDESKLASSGLNAFKFWKKFMATALGSYCHPSIFDDNGRKIGLTYAPPFDLASNPVSTFVAGGPLEGAYTPEDILVGKATEDPFLRATFKKLPTSYRATGLVIGVSMKTVISVAGSTRICWYGPYSISMKDTDMVGKTQDAIVAIPQAGMSKYDIIATYKCPNSKDNEKIIESGLNLNTQEADRHVTIDFTKFPACPKPTVPGMPGARPQ